MLVTFKISKEEFPIKCVAIPAKEGAPARLLVQDYGTTLFFTNEANFKEGYAESIEGDGYVAGSKDGAQIRTRKLTNVNYVQGAKPLAKS